MFGRSHTTHGIGVRHHADQGGETLIEVLIGVVIISITAATLLGALIVTLTSSGEHRSLANLDTVLRSSAETVTCDLELQPCDASAPGSASGPWFGNCASVTSTTYTVPRAPTQTFVFPSGYNLTVTGIQYWNSNSSQFVTDTSSSCQANPNEQTGYQLLTLSGTAPNGVSASLSVAVRSPT